MVTWELVKRGDSLHNFISLFLRQGPMERAPWQEQEPGKNRNEKLLKT